MKFSTQKTGCGCSGVSSENSCGCSAAQTVTSACPVCGMVGLMVGDVTIKSQLKKDHLENLEDKSGFSFCTNPECDAVYYRGETLFAQKDVRNKVFAKNNDPQTPSCYCKKLLKSDFFAMLETGEPNISAKLKEIIASGKSFCEKSNPKGACCTEDVKKFIEAHGLVWNERGAGGGCCWVK